jgi:hypothetical protein
MFLLVKTISAEFGDVVSSLSLFVLTFSNVLSETDQLAGLPQDALIVFQSLSFCGVI